MVKKRVLLALSGGVDSSVCAHLLRLQNYEITGVTFLIYHDNSRLKHLQRGLNDALIIAEKLNIPHFIIDLKKEFKNEVIQYFLDSYLNGLTPNPCVHCNPLIKWNTLLNLADEFDCEFIATGHYAKTVHLNGQYYLGLPADSTKDQTYFLWKLNQDQIKRTIFPLSDMKKDDVKKLAHGLGFEHISKKKESYNICFIPDGNYREYIESNPGLKNNSKFNGEFVTENDEKAGEYHGIWNFTIGQHFGKVLSPGTKLYIMSINAEKAKITIGPKEKLYKKTAILKSYQLPLNLDKGHKLRLKVKYSYRSPFEECDISVFEDALKAEFINPVYGLAPGQSIVFYSDNLLLGGGIIYETLEC